MSFCKIGVGYKRWHEREQNITAVGSAVRCDILKLPYAERLAVVRELITMYESSGDQGKESVLSRPLCWATRVLLEQFGQAPGRWECMRDADPLPPWWREWTRVVMVAWGGPAIDREDAIRRGVRFFDNGDGTSEDLLPEIRAARGEAPAHTGAACRTERAKRFTHPPAGAEG